MKNKEHLTPEGLSKIRKIKAGMNQGRFPTPIFFNLIGKVYY
jgi:hypothetical protein